MDENQLMKIKKDIEKRKESIQKNEGKLESVFDKNKNLLNLPLNTPDNDVLKEMDTKVLKLKENQKEDTKRLDEITEEIEEEMESWED